MDDTQNFLITFERNALFKGLDKPVIERLAHNATLHDVPKGHHLFTREDQAHEYYFILDGWVKLFRETLDGTQTIIDILRGGHIFGETAIFEDNQYPYSAEITEQARIARLPLNALQDEINRTPALALNMMQSMARYRRQQDSEIEHLSLQNAPQRIGCFILKLLDSPAQNHGPVRLQLPYDKALVAARLGMQPETFSRALKKLVTATDIEIQGSQIDIQDLNRLVQFSCSACSSEFPCKDLNQKEQA